MQSTCIRRIYIYIYAVYIRRTAVYVIHIYANERIISGGGMLSENFKGRGSSGWKTTRGQRSDAGP